jgi:membrane carboxypeptidase/penicillin-binding protein PbpC
MAVAPRQPGSAFKPITYAAALESGQFTEVTVVADERTVFRTRRGDVYVPENYDHQFHGRVPLRVALASSLNVPAVQVESAIGLDAVLDLAERLGLGSTLGDRERYDLSLTLGGGEVRLLDLTAAYATFATGGVFHSPRVLLDSEHAGPRRVVSAETAWLIDDMLSDDAARGPGFGRDSVLDVPGRPVAVKTGTTSDFRDNWTIGFTPDLVVGVWVGNADNQPMRDVSGVTGAAPLWRDVLDALTDGQPVHAFERPPDLRQTELCADSSALADADCPLHRLEWLPDSMLSQPAPASTAPALPLRIVFPDPDTVITLDASLPATAQQVAIEVDAGAAGGDIDVLVDDGVVGSVAAPGGVVAWSPTPGRHVIRAVAAGASTVAVEIAVLADAGAPSR